VFVRFSKPVQHMVGGDILVALVACHGGMFLDQGWLRWIGGAGASGW
jgi:hypothetical protein